MVRPYIILRTQRLARNSVVLADEPPRQDIRCLQIHVLEQRYDI